MNRDMTELKAGVFHSQAEPLPILVGGLWERDLDTEFYTPERIQITHYVSISTREQPYFIRVQAPEQKPAMFWGLWYRTDKATAERIKHAFLECFVDGLFDLSLWQKKRHPGTVAEWARGINLPGVDGVCFDSDAFPPTQPSAEKKETSAITLQEIREACRDGVSPWVMDEDADRKAQACAKKVWALLQRKGLA